MFLYSFSCRTNSKTIFLNSVLWPNTNKTSDIPRLLVSCHIKLFRVTHIQKILPLGSIKIESILSVHKLYVLYFHVPAPTVHAVVVLWWQWIQSRTVKLKQCNVTLKSLQKRVRAWENKTICLTLFSWLWGVYPSFQSSLVVIEDLHLLKLTQQLRLTRR